MRVNVKAREVRSKVFEATSSTQLEADIQAWCGARTEELVLGVEYQSNGTSHHAALLLYTR